jgi:hypothetical protein
VKKGKFRGSVFSKDATHLPHFEGHLDKFGKRFWGGRYFALNNHYMNYYNNKGKKQLLASVDLCELDPVADPRGSEFSLFEEGKRVWALRAKNGKEAAEWVKRIRDRVAYYNANVSLMLESVVAKAQAAPDSLEAKTVKVFAESDDDGGATEGSVAAEGSVVAEPVSDVAAFADSVDAELASNVAAGVDAVAEEHEASDDELFAVHSSGSEVVSARSCGDDDEAPLVRSLVGIFYSS